MDPIRLTQATSQLPDLDTAQPADVRTATFAMG
jgi:hypothetical protein